MKLLLDTHIFLWLQSEPERLGSQLAIVEDPATELLVSAASTWELAIKTSIGKLRLPLPVIDYVPTRAALIGAELIAVGHRDAAGVAALPPLHCDPFDRLLLAQAAAQHATLLTADAVLADYPTDVLVVS